MFDRQVFTETPEYYSERYRRAFVWLKIVAILGVVGLSVGWVAAVIAIFAIAILDSWKHDLFRRAKLSGYRFAFISGTIVLGLSLASGFAATKQFGVSKGKAWLLAFALFALGETLSDTIAFYKAQNARRNADALASVDRESAQGWH